MRAGVLPSTSPAACATATGATNDVHEPPLGRSTAASSAAPAVSVRIAWLSVSCAITCTGTVCGRAPVRPATALNPSDVTVPRSWPEAASLYVVPIWPSWFGLLTTRKT